MSVFPGLPLFSSAWSWIRLLIARLMLAVQKWRMCPWAESELLSLADSFFMGPSDTGSGITFWCPETPGKCRRKTKKDSSVGTSGEFYTPTPKSQPMVITNQTWQHIQEYGVMSKSLLNLLNVQLLCNQHIPNTEQNLVTYLSKTKCLLYGTCYSQRKT